MEILFLFLETFLGVVVIGLSALFLYILIRNIIYPKKISTLKTYLKNGNYKSAINIAKEILKKNPNNIEAHYYLGEAYYKMEKYELALMEYKAAEKTGLYQNIDEKSLREKLANLYIKTGNIDEALKEYILLIKQNPSDYIYYYQAGELFLKKNQTNNALKFFAHSANLNKNHAPTLFNIGIILYENKNFTSAQKYLQKSLELDPNNLKAYFYLGLIDSSMNNYKSALKNFEKVISDKEFKLKALVERAKIYMAMGDYNTAIIELERALKNTDEEKNNITLNIKYLLANCYELNRNVIDAIKYWEQIYSVNPSFKDVAEKLISYQDLRMDDRMKDFMTATDTDFIDMAKRIVEYMGLNIVDVDILTKDSVEIFCLEQDTKWRNVKKKPKIIHISRKTTPIDEGIIRNLSEKMKQKGVIRSMVITASSFTKGALNYAKERPIELIDKNGLQEILKNANI